VPTNDFITLTDYVPNLLASPKSANFILKSESIKMLEGARSLCTILFMSCKYLRAPQSWVNMFQITSSFTLFFFSDYEIMKSARLTPSRSSITMYIFYPFGKEVKYLVILG
jgi:hypothetical protein